MLTILVVIINISISILGIYLFDYKVDNLINNPLAIIISIIVGTIIMILVLLLYIEGFYQLVAKKQPINSKLKHFLAKQLMAVPMHATNRRVKVIGLENLPKDPGFTIYSNHTSMFDIPVLMCSIKKYPIAFLSKEMVIGLPFIGKWTTALGCVLLDRTNDRKGAESIIQVIKHVKSGSSMVIFPEGTRTYEIGKMIDFKSGSFRVALKSKRPLVPITIVKPKHYNIIKWPFKKRITIVIHKPLLYDSFKNLSSLELADKVKDIIGKEL